jgi:hypothetical protein
MNPSSVDGGLETAIGHAGFTMYRRAGKRDPFG